MRRLTSLLLALLLAVGMAACGDGEDRPGQVTAEEDSKSGSVSGTGTGSASGTGSVSGSGTGSASGTAAHDDHTDSGSVTTAFPVASATDTVKIEMKDFDFVGMPASVTGPRIAFESTNAGPSEHELVIAPESGDNIQVIGHHPKGQERKGTVELQPGTYTALCLIKVGTQTHADMGMKATFAVT